MMKRRLLLTTALTGVAFGARAAMKDDVNNPSVVSPLTNLTTSFPGLNVNGASNSITITAMPGSGATSSTVNFSFSYTGAAPGGMTAVWNPGTLSAAITSFSASGGTGSATAATPATAATYTLTATGTGANTSVATASNATVISAPGAVPMPSLANRPSFNSGTNVLTWQGPLGGGPSNGSYVTQTRTLTASGGVTTTAAGQTIQGLNIQTAVGAAGYASNPWIVVAHNNTTIKQNRMFGTSTNLSTGNQIGIQINSGITGTVIEDCYLDLNNRNGGSGSGGTNIVGCSTTGLFVSVTCRRNVFTRSEQAFSSPMNNCSFTENYCTLIGGTDADWVECYPRGNFPGIQNLLIQYNVFDGTDNNNPGADSGVNLTTGSGLPVGSIGYFVPNATTVTIDSNWFINWTTIHPLVADDTNNGAGNTGHLNFGFTNNGVHPGTTYVFQAGLVGPQSSISPNSGNYIMATVTSTSGALVNGTGVIS